MQESRAAARAPPTAAAGAWNRIETRFGTFHAATVQGALVQTALPGQPIPEFLAILSSRHPSINFREDARDPVLSKAAAQLQEYSEGKRQGFELPLRMEGTAFQTMVWNALAAIPFGETRSYQDIARAIGRPGASRAVGQANHHNPLAPIVPCHRVVNSSGGLGGYGGGMDLKRALLAHEGIAIDESVP